MKLTSDFELNGEHFSLHMVTSPQVKPHVYHVYITSKQVTKQANHTGAAPIEATIYADKIELSNLPDNYTDSDAQYALKKAIQISLLGQ